MPKTKQQKQATIATLTQGLKTGKGVVFANFQGLTVAEAEDLRRNCRKEDVTFLVAKKTLLNKACQDLGLDNINPKSFAGGVATFVGLTDEVTPARIVNTFAKTHEVVSIFGGLLEGKFIDSAMVKSLANLPSKTELLSRMVGSFNAPLSGLVNVLAGNLRGLARVLNAYKDKKATV